MSLTRENTSRFLEVDGVNVHFHVAGNGPTLLMIHGGAPGAFGWGNFGRNLEALAQHFRTIIVDLPGYGKSDKPDVSGPRDQFYAQIFKGLLERLNVQKAHILGMATGGGVAFHMAINWPEIVDRLVILSSPGGLQLFTLMPQRLNSHIGLSEWRRG
jgi:4,5:9,10-diseco-3-hydroxy-5,9,17-trioxoandrosta-1(10),2-diene-4-oate hydrolase